MKSDDNVVPSNNNWYRRKLNNLKNEMKHWYTQDRYNLTLKEDKVSPQVTLSSFSHKTFETCYTNMKYYIKKKIIII